MEKINIAEILRNCPQGMELDCTMLDNVVFEKIDFSSSHHPIIIRRTETNKIIHLTKYGQYSTVEDYKCIIFPKGKTSWEGFVPPCEFKDGDIVVNKIGKPFILKSYDLSKNNVCSYCGISCWDNFELSSEYWTCARAIRYATEEEKAKLFDAIKANGYKWNAETKTLEKLIVPKFKVGDYIRQNKKNPVCLVSEVCDNYYLLDEKDICLPFFAQDEWDLVPEKFDICTLEPYENRVLVRNSKDQYWIPAYWGYKAKYGYVTTFGRSNYCIPYEGNEHLLMTKDDCSELYKTE